jgi:hypothetical protein
MAFRMHPLSAARWQRLAASRHEYEGRPPAIDLVVLEAETDPHRRSRAEVSLIQAYVAALAPQRVSR